MEQEKTRQSNFELLRIVAMIMIVFFHFAMHSGFKFDTNLITIPRMWQQLILMGGKVGVNVFVLISGYFLIHSSKLKISKVLKLWAQIFFYSVVIYGIFVACGLEKFSVKELIKSILPITFEQWWFASSYFVLYLLSPFINIFLKNLDRQIYKKMLMVMTICWSVIPSFLSKNFQSNDLIWFFYLYSLAGYIKLYGENFELKSNIYFKMTLIVAVLNFLVVILFDLIGFKITYFGKNATYFYNMKRIPTLLTSVFLFLGFKNIEIKNYKIINLISSATFGVYLIHDNNFMRSFLWKKILNGPALSNHIVLIPYSILVVVLVYSICTMIELLRIYLLEKNYMKIIEKIEIKMDKIINKMMDLKIVKKF